MPLPCALRVLCVCKHSIAAQWILGLLLMRQFGMYIRGKVTKLPLSYEASFILKLNPETH